MKKIILITSLLLLNHNLFAIEKINGAGATFPYPLYSKWFSEYKKIVPNVEFNYQSIGSGGGIKQVQAETVDFGASDAPMTEEEIKKNKAKIIQIPLTLGGIAVAYNQSQIPNHIKLDGPTVASIFTGSITKWNDPAIINHNPGIQLPDLDILVIRRSDGSGTTASSTEFLSTTSDYWKNNVGTG